MNKLKSSLLWLWQLPQNLCGIIYRSISKDNRICVIENDDSRSVGAKVYLQRAKGGVTLGKYVFINQDYTDKEAVIKHECGHVKQSKILGPLYLLVIGIPSILHAWLNNYIGCCKKHGTYYHFYTEKSANKLMGIE
jgi:hypothetical protein